MFHSEPFEYGYHASVHVHPRPIEEPVRIDSRQGLKTYELRRWYLRRRQQLVMILLFATLPMMRPKLRTSSAPVSSAREAFCSPSSSSSSSDPPVRGQHRQRDELKGSSVLGARRGAHPEGKRLCALEHGHRRVRCSALHSPQSWREEQPPPPQRHEALYPRCPPLVDAQNDVRSVPYESGDLAGL